MQRYGALISMVAASCAASTAAAERIELRDGDMVISAPAEVDCDTPPDFTLENAGAALFAEDRNVLDTLVAQMASGLAASCEAVDRVTVKGEDRGVTFSFEVTRADGWRLDGPVAATPEPSATPVAATATALPVPEPEPEPKAESVATAEPEPAAPERPPVEPGLDFTTFTSIFGSVPTVRGHVAFDNSEIWSRVLAARMYAENPDVLDNDTNAIELLAQMATQPEYVQVLGPLANRQPQQMSVFERRDLAERIRTQLRGGLDQRRQTGPILVYNAVGLRLGEYDFNTGTFPLPNVENARNHRTVSWKNATIQSAFSNVVLPERLGATQEQARQLDTYLRNRNDATIYLAIFAEIDPVMPPSLSDYHGGQPPATNTSVTEVALYADKGLSQVLYDFTPDLAAAQAEADLAAAALTRKLSSGEDAVRAIDTVNGGAAAATSLADIFARNDYNQTGESAETRRATALSIIEAASDDRTMRLAGSLRIGTYDPVRQVLPVSSLSLQGLQFASLQTNAGFRVDLVPALAEIPVDAETASRITAAASNTQLEFRLDSELMQGSHRAPNGEYIEINATLKPRKLQLFAGPQNYNRGPRQLLLDLELPDNVTAVPSLMDALTLPQ